MDQTLINYLGGAVLAALGWFARTIYDKQEAQAKSLNDFKVEVARDYVSNPELANALGDIRDDLKYIRDRLDSPNRRHTDPGN